MSNKNKDRASKGRRWIFSKKKMKDDSSALTGFKELPYDLKDLLEQKNINLKPRTNQCKISKLSPSLMDILKKSVGLGHFLEYLAEIKSKYLLDFWLEAETLLMVLETNYSRKSPSLRRRLSRSKSLSTPSKKDQCSKESTKTEQTSIKTDLQKQNSRSKVEIENKDKEALPLSNQDDINGLILTDSKGESKNTYDEPLNRRPSTLRSYEDFKTRAKSRSTNDAIVDAVEIYTKFISLDAESSINLPSDARHKIEATICKDTSQLDTTCFVEAQEFVFLKLECLYEEFLSTTNMLSYQLHVLEEGELKFQDIFYEEQILFYFLEFLDLYKAKTVYEFYITGENFEEDMERKLNETSYDVDEAINDAMYIYERYFSMKCDRQLIADDKLRIVLENNICRDDGPQPNCFCIPMAYAWTTLSEVYLPLFLESNIYDSYQSHLKKTLHYTEEVKSCSSRSSISLEDNVPLCVADAPPRSPAILEKTESKLNLFEESNLEDFWFKPQTLQSDFSASRLTLGHVNEFGVFCSGMEEQPLDEKHQDSSVKKLGKKMKDLLRGETTEETEQQAWERARKIIDDIQKQTAH